MLNKALGAFGDLGDDEELGPADWATVKRHITSLSHVEGEPLHPHNAFESDQNVRFMNLRDIRLRLLNGKVSLCCYSSVHYLLKGSFAETFGVKASDGSNG
ncbi:sodium/hydrogen exchanger 8 [Cucumis melo var. makuwa]|uniref:Sodium/hydrogen exchanger 8 n=1 Tax=Cucumis melo var. makuwa TaxID=1194695 RepID=A0A5A7VIP0_CUCMM|nr:sodium/hydrogen exchanger 8 [Cucumis melo var. makuwa]